MGAITAELVIIGAAMAGSCFIIGFGSAIIGVVGFDSAIIGGCGAMGLCSAIIGLLSVMVGCGAMGLCSAIIGLLSAIIGLLSVMVGCGAMGLCSAIMGFGSAMIGAAKKRSIMTINHQFAVASYFQRFGTTAGSSRGSGSLEARPL